MTTIEQAERDIARIEDVARTLADAVNLCTQLEDNRALVKAAAVRRIMQTTNEETQKPHSATSAEKVVEIDPFYAEHRSAQREAEIAKQVAFAQYEAAKLTARLAVECVALDGAA
jgi:hypothetical protein